MKDIQKNNKNNFLLLFYLFTTVYLIPLEKYKVVYNTLILFIPIITVFISIKLNKKLNRNFFIIFLFFSILYFLNAILVSYSEIVLNQYILFLGMSIIPFYLSSLITDFENLEKQWYSFSKFAFYLLIFLLLVDRRSMNYMRIGISFSYCIPGILINHFKFRKKFDLLLIAIISFTTLIFGNRGAFLVIFTNISFVVFFFYCNKKKKIIIAFLTGIVIFLRKMIGQIINVGVLFLSEYLSSKNIRSYSIKKIVMMFEKGLKNSSSGRDFVYEITLQRIQESNYFPKGIGYLKFSDNINYPHNIFLDLGITFGFLNLIIIPIFIYFLVRTLKNKSKRLILISIIFISFGRLMASSTFLLERTFWILLGMIIFRKSNVK